MDSYKTCNQCGAKNKTTAKFCSECGNSDWGSTKVCKNCGAENKNDARFCSECGSAMGQKKKAVQSKKQVNRKKAPVKTGQDKNKIWIAAAVIVVVIGYLFVKDSGTETVVRSQNFQAGIENVSGNLQLEGNVKAIASRFSCSCGNCNAEPLETCTCPTAQQERNFIRDALRAGQTAEQVIQAVSVKYGWMKPEYAAKNSSPADLQSLVKNKPIKAIPDEVAGTLAVAKLADQNYIETRFSCPCGQCSIDELAECNCGHPRGAQEVKGFISNQIALAKFSRDEIVDMVDKKYGHRIR